MKNHRASAGLFACACIGLAPMAFADGSVYAMTNALGSNQIKVYHRASDGTLLLMQTVRTSGGGSGIQLDGTDSLGSQGSLILDKNHQRLFAVNTESLATHTASGPLTGDCEQGSISSFLVGSDGTLTFVEKTPSGGMFPNSLTIDGNVLYVLNAGGPGISPTCGHAPNITGFTVTAAGKMTPLNKSTQSINPGTTPTSFLNCDATPGSSFSTPEYQCGMNPPAFPRSPGQVGFTPGGKALIVTEKATNSIYVFPVKNNTPRAPVISKAYGPNQPTYFGFAFDANDHLIVAEPFGATPVIPAQPFSAVSSFAIGGDGILHEISAEVPTGQGTGCWIAVVGTWAYTSDNGTGNISIYQIASDGTLTLMTSAGGSVTGPNDLAVAADGTSTYLYALEAGAGTIGAFKINSDGSLTFLQSAPGLPVTAGAQGLAAY